METPTLIELGSFETIRKDLNFLFEGGFKLKSAVATAGYRVTTKLCSFQHKTT